MVVPASAIFEPGTDPEPDGHPARDTMQSVDEPLTCSAKGCPAPAVWALLWNNPKLHTPERRKTWLACEGHRESLSAFLGARSFLKDVVAVEDRPEP